MINNKVYPQTKSIYTQDSNKNSFSPKKRIKNIGKWLLAISGFPIAYIILPVSCCIRNPAVNAFDDTDIPPAVTAGEKI